MNIQQEGAVRSRRTREEVRQLVSAFPAGGLGAREFYQQHGLALSTLEGKPHGRPRSAARKQGQVRELFAQGVSKAEIARRLAIGRTSVRRLLTDPYRSHRLYWRASSAKHDRGTGRAHRHGSLGRR